MQPTIRTLINRAANLLIVPIIGGCIGGFILLLFNSPQWKRGTELGATAGAAIAFKCLLVDWKEDEEDVFSKWGESEN